MGSPTIAALFAQRVVVGVGDMAVSNNTQVVLTTYALGSCVGVLAYDPVVKAAGILHLMLPESSISPDKALKQPAMFADTGLPAFFQAMGGLRAESRRVRLFLAGGASVLNGQDPFKIGERNARVSTNWVTTKGLQIRHRHLGGVVNRTVHLEVSTGVVSMKTPSGNETFALGD